MTNVPDQALLVVSKGGPQELNPSWQPFFKGLQAVGLMREWGENDLTSELGSRAQGYPDASGVIAAMAGYYDPASDGERRAREDAVVMRKATDDPDVSIVLAELLFAAPALGAIGVEERSDRVLVVRGCGRTIGLRMSADVNGRGTVPIHHAISAVNALLTHTSELRRFVPLVELPGVQTFAFRTQGQTEALFQLGMLGAAPGHLKNYAWWTDSPAAATPGERRSWVRPEVRAVG